MAQIRLAYSKTGRYVTKSSAKKSAPPSLVLAPLQLLSWKIERLNAQRPAAVEVLENLVDDMLEEIERGHL